MNIHFFIMLIIAFVVFLSDILIYIFNLNYGFAIIIGICIVGGFVFAKRKEIKLEFDFEKLDFVFFVILILLSSATFFKCDAEYDTKYYHIYMQENPFIDKINFDFFPGKFVTSFTFPLGDRIHFLARNILGFRLGTILSTYSVVVLYYEVKKLIKLIYNNNSKWIPIMANISYMSFVIVTFIGRYYVDIFSLIFILQIIIMFFESDNFIKDKKILYLSFFISGIATRN